MASSSRSFEALSAVWNVYEVELKFGLTHFDPKVISKTPPVGGVDIFATVGLCV